MRKLVILILLCSTALFSEEFLFSDFEFGMSKEQIYVMLGIPIGNNLPQEDDNDFVIGYIDATYQENTGLLTLGFENKKLHLISFAIYSFIDKDIYKDNQSCNDIIQSLEDDLKSDLNLRKPFFTENNLSLEKLKKIDVQDSILQATIWNTDAGGIILGAALTELFLESVFMPVILLMNEQITEEMLDELPI